MKYPIAVFLLSICLSIGFASELLAGEQQRLIAVQGEAKTELEPNRAILSIELKQNRNSLVEARQAVSTTLNALVLIVNKQGITDASIEKTQIWQGPNFVWENNKQVLKGYNASMQLKITVDNLDVLANLADALAKVNDVTLQNTAFTRSDIEKLQVEQRKLALLNARQKAGDMLAVYNEVLGPVLTIHEAGSVEPVVYDNRMQFKAAMSMAEAAPAQEPGSWAKVTISANVQVEFGIQDSVR